MDELTEHIQEVLSDPEQMARIMGMAQSLMGESASGDAAPEADAGLMQKLGAILQGEKNGGSQQQALLQAMRPYLSEKRQRKMERALRMTRMAHLAKLAMNGLGGGEDAETL